MINSHYLKLDYVLNPINIFSHVSYQPYSIFLDSCDLDRYMILAWDPLIKVDLYRNDLNSFDVIDNLLAKLPETSYFENNENLPPFFTGIIGYLGYELGNTLKYDNTIGSREDIKIPDGVIMIPKKTIVIDSYLKQSWVIITEEHDLDLEEELNLFVNEINLWSAVSLKSDRVDKNYNFNLIPSISLSEYQKKIRRILDYIAQGDIYQANFTYKISCDNCEGDPWELYQILRLENKGPFAAYFNIPGYTILSSSPELFLDWNEQAIQTKPIKGTRPRGKTEEEDIYLKNELAQSEKDHAELIMIVDLERNDLGKICNYGSIKVKDLLSIQQYQTVWHQVAIVEGILLDNIKASEILKATFPGGSITGAPKIRAMQIIEELEVDKRGVYTGSIGFIDKRNIAKWNIAIRTMVWTKDEISFNVGGGIVADSNVLDEYDESLVKAKGMINALNKWSKRGLDSRHSATVSDSDKAQKLLE